MENSNFDQNNSSQDDSVDVQSKYLLAPSKSKSKIVPNKINVGPEHQAIIPTMVNEKQNVTEVNVSRPSILRIGEEYEYHKYAQIRTGQQFQATDLPMPGTWKPQNRKAEEVKQNSSTKENSQENSTIGIKRKPDEKESKEQDNLKKQKTDDK